jgi:hypothetical protein
MKTAAGAVLVAGALLFAGPATAQYYPQQPAPQPYPPPAPPQYYPPPPPQYYPPPPPPTYYPPRQPEANKLQTTLRASGGVAFASQGYYCGYYGYYGVAYTCTAGYGAVWPDVNLDIDFWVKPTIGLTVGANVMWGTYTPSVPGVPPSSISSTTWEPHIDVLVSVPGNPDVKGRVRFGFGLYVASINGVNATGNAVSYNSVGGAFRLGFGASLLASSRVGIGVDAIFEAGWIGSSYVSTVQLLIGPEFHF